MGCKVNSCDSCDFYSDLVSYGFEYSDPEAADIIIINSCAVTRESVRKTRQYINRFRKINNDSFIILTGCASILEEFKANSALDSILNRNDLINFISNKFGAFRIFDKNITSFEKTRAFIKIEDGCENFCSYCIIPFTRGKVRSKSIEDIDYEAKKLSELGFKEIVLTGINLGRYGQGTNFNIIDALNVVSKYFGRIRLSSLEPDTLNQDIINEIAKIGTICPNFHLSLQSGSNKILKMMNRKYDIDYYLNVIYLLREKFKNVTFTTDIIVGYPGETDEDFNKTMHVINKVSFIKVNVFPFSPRPFTLASSLTPIDENEKIKRSKRTIEESERISKCEIEKFEGKKFDVLFEYKNKEGLYEGYSENYIRIKYRSDENLCGKIKNVIFCYLY